MASTGGRSASGTRRRSPRSAEHARQAARRRAIQQLAGLGTLVVLLLVVLVVGVRFVLSQLSQHDEAAKAVPSNLYSPVACNPEIVETTITPKGGTAGQPVAFDVTLHNKSKTNPCYLNVGWSNLEVNITSGSAQVASLASCKAGAERKQLLLDRDYTAKVQLTWQGGVAAAGCGNGGDPARAGTYVATLSFVEGTAAGAKQPFTLQ